MCSTATYWAQVNMTKSEGSRMWSLHVKKVGWKGQLTPLIDPLNPVALRPLHTLQKTKAN